MEVLTLRPLADRAVTINLADRAGPDAGRRVAGALAALEAALASGELPGVEEVAASFASLTVHYDCTRIAQGDLADRLRAVLAEAAPAADAGARLWELPCSYAPADGIDLEALSGALALSPAEIVRRHAGAYLTVRALGFLPGLPFLGDLPEALRLPRRSEPRTRVPAGSVAIANGMCVIYPWASPGGWHIVGRCPVPLFDAGRERPALLAVGDRVRFRAVTPDERDALDADRAAGRLDLAGFGRDAP